MADEVLACGCYRRGVYWTRCADGARLLADWFEAVKRQNNCHYYEFEQISVQQEEAMRSLYAHYDNVEVSE